MCKDFTAFCNWWKTRFAKHSKPDANGTPSFIPPHSAGYLKWRINEYLFTQCTRMNWYADFSKSNSNLKWNSSWLNDLTRFFRWEIECVFIKLILDVRHKWELRGNLKLSKQPLWSSWELLENNFYGTHVIINTIISINNSSISHRHTHIQAAGEGEGRSKGHVEIKFSTLWNCQKRDLIFF